MSGMAASNFESRAVQDGDTVTVTDWGDGLFTLSTERVGRESSDVVLTEDDYRWLVTFAPTPVAAPPRTGDDAEIAAELDEIAAAVRVLENCYYPLIKSVDWGIQFRTSERVKALATRLRNSRGGR